MTPLGAARNPISAPSNADLSKKALLAEATGTVPLYKERQGPSPKHHPRPQVLVSLVPGILPIRKSAWPKPNIPIPFVSQDV